MAQGPGPPGPPLGSRGQPRITVRAPCPPWLESPLLPPPLPPSLHHAAGESRRPLGNRTVRSQRSAAGGSSVSVGSTVSAGSSVSADPLARERAHLSASRSALRAMREDVESLDIRDVTANWVNSIVL